MKRMHVRLDPKPPVTADQGFDVCEYPVISPQVAAASEDRAPPSRNQRLGGQSLLESHGPETPGYGTLSRPTACDVPGVWPREGTRDRCIDV